MFSHILVWYDGSSPSKAALAEAVDLAQSQKAALEVVTVYTSLQGWRAEIFPAMPPEAFNALLEEAKQVAQTLLNDALARVPKWVPVTGSVLDGQPAEAVLSQAVHSCADLVVVGLPRGRATGLPGHRLVHASSVPVLVIRAQAPPAPRQPRRGRTVRAPYAGRPALGALSSG